MSNHPTVSFDDEPLILVDAGDSVTGYQDKAKTHEGDGLLHRAFSIFLLNRDGAVLLQQRSADKPLWPLYWSNSCCSHPRRGESYQEATHRRLREELSVDTELEFLYQFQYHAPFKDLGSERELCSVFIGRLDQTDGIDVNPTEIAAWRWFQPSEADALIADRPDQVTPWFAMEWQRLREEFQEHMQAIK